MILPASTVILWMSQFALHLYRVTCLTRVYLRTCRELYSFAPDEIQQNVNTSTYSCNEDVTELSDSSNLNSFFFLLSLNSPPYFHHTAATEWAEGPWKAQVWAAWGVGVR